MKSCMSQEELETGNNTKLLNFRDFSNSLALRKCVVTLFDFEYAAIRSTLVDHCIVYMLHGRKISLIFEYMTRCTITCSVALYFKPDQNMYNF